MKLLSSFLILDQVSKGNCLKYITLFTSINILGIPYTMEIIYNIILVLKVSASVAPGCGVNGMKCVTECPATKVGRKGAALQKFFYEGDDTIWTRLTAKNNYVAGDPNDYRFTIRFDKAGFQLCDVSDVPVITICSTSI